MVDISPAAKPKSKSPVPLGIGLTLTGVLIWFYPLLNLAWQKSLITTKLPNDLHGLDKTTNDAAKAVYKTLQDNLFNIVEANSLIMWGAALCLGAPLLAIGVTLIVSHYITLDVVVSSKAEDNPTGIAAALRGPAVLIGFVTLALWFIILTTFLPMLVNAQGERFDYQLVALTGEKHGLEASNKALTGERDSYREVLEALARDNAQSVLIGFRCGNSGTHYANGWRKGGPEGPTGLLGPGKAPMAAENSLTVEGGEAWHTINVGHTSKGVATPVLQVNVTEFGLAAIILLDGKTPLFTLCNAPNDAEAELNGTAQTAQGTVPGSGSGAKTSPPTPPQDDLLTKALKNSEVPG